MSSSLPNDLEAGHSHTDEADEKAPVTQVNSSTTNAESNTSNQKVQDDESVDANIVFWDSSIDTESKRLHQEIGMLLLSYFENI